MSKKIGHYEIVTELGRGGMGVVYKGHEAALNRYVAIKVLSPALAHDESIKERFLREARSMAALNDPHIIQVYFIGEHEGQPFFAMEFVEGESLSTYLKREGSMSPEQAARVIYQTALGLASAHDKGVIHRDIKPGNLMLNARGQIKIADFGIAMSSADFSKKLTSTGEFVGTPGYLSPEVCTGQVVDSRSDIFSLGIVLFELLTGRMPFADESPLGLLLEVVRAEIPDIQQLNSKVDPELTRILKRMTEKDPAIRYPDCHELAADLAKHPLVQGSHAVNAKPVVSAAAQTVIGMKTPSGQTGASRTAGTPTDGAITAQVPSVGGATVARPSVLDKPPQRRSHAGAAIAIAAVLVLALTAGGAYAMRERLPFLQSWLQSSANTQASNAPVALAAPSAAASPQNAAAQASASTSSNDQAIDQLTGSDSPGASQQVEGGVSGVHEDIAGVGTEQGGESGFDDEESMGPLRRMAAQRQAEITQDNAPVPVAGEAARIANAPITRPAEPRAPMGPPKVAVVAFGDPAVTSPARQEIEERLMGQGFLVADSDTLHGLSRGSLPQVLAAAPRHGVRAIIVVRAEPMGTTQLNYYGQSDTMYSANLSVRPYDTATRAPLSAGIRTKVDYTALNAQSETQDAIAPELNRMIGALSAYRLHGKGG